MSFATMHAEVRAMPTGVCCSQKQIMFKANMTADRAMLRTHSAIALAANMLVLCASGNSAQQQTGI